jgi:hypothetical protein
MNLPRATGCGIDPHPDRGMIDGPGRKEFRIRRTIRRVSDPGMGVQKSHQQGDRGPRLKQTPRYVTTREAEQRDGKREVM